MNILIDELPRLVKVNGAEYPINFGFRAIILCENCIFDAKLSEQERILHALNIFYIGHIPTDLSKAMELFHWFYNCGKSANKTATVGNSSKAKRSYDFEQDAKYIFAAFMSQYDINLQRISNNDLHWWEFRAMFNSMDENLKICKIMGYRVMDLTDMSKKQKKLYKELKAQYALKDDQNVSEKMKLAKRNQQMLDYVKSRYKGVGE